MNKASKFFTILLASLMLFSCGGKDKRLDNFSQDTIYEYLISKKKINIMYNVDSCLVGYKKDENNILFTNETGEGTQYKIIDDLYYNYDESGYIQVDIEEIENNIIYYIETYMFDYKKYKENNKMLFVEEKENLNSTNELLRHYYVYNVEMFSTDEGKSGYQYYINAETGITISKNGYGPSKAFLESTNSCFSLSNFSYGD